MTSYELTKLKVAALRAERIEQLRPVLVELIEQCHYRQVEIEAVRDLPSKLSWSQHHRTIRSQAGWNAAIACLLEAKPSHMFV